MSLVVDAAIETIIDSVVEGKKVSILGFGSFEPRERSARQGLNPKTGEKIKIPAKRVPAFTAGKMFKDRVQGWLTARTLDRGGPLGPPFLVWTFLIVSGSFLSRGVNSVSWVIAAVLLRLPQVLCIWATCARP